MSNLIFSNNNSYNIYNKTNFTDTIKNKKNSYYNAIKISLIWSSNNTYNNKNETNFTVAVSNNKSSSNNSVTRWLDIFQYFAIYNNKNWPRSIFMPK